MPASVLNATVPKVAAQPYPENRLSPAMMQPNTNQPSVMLTKNGLPVLMSSIPDDASDALFGNPPGGGLHNLQPLSPCSPGSDAIAVQHPRSACSRLEIVVPTQGAGTQVASHANALQPAPVALLAGKN